MTPNVIPTQQLFYKRLWADIKEIFHALLSEWLAWFGIIFLVIAFSCSTLAIVSGVFSNPGGAGQGSKLIKAALDLNFIGTTWVLAGTLWTAIGVFVSKKKLDKLNDMEANGHIPAGEIIANFRIQSNFAKSGSAFIIIGTTLLLYKVLVS